MLSCCHGIIFSRVNRCRCDDCRCCTAEDRVRLGRIPKWSITRLSCWHTSTYWVAELTPFWAENKVLCDAFPSLKHWYFAPCLPTWNKQRGCLSTTSVLDFFPPEKSQILPCLTGSGFVHFDPAWQECRICVEKGYPHGYTLTDNTLVVSCLSFASKTSCKTLDKSVSFTYFVWQTKPSERASGGIVTPSNASMHTGHLWGLWRHKGPCRV